MRELQKKVIQEFIFILLVNMRRDTGEKCQLHYIAYIKFFPNSKSSNVVIKVRLPKFVNAIMLFYAQQSRRTKERGGPGFETPPLAGKLHVSYGTWLFLLMKCIPSSPPPSAKRKSWLHPCSSYLRRIAIKIDNYFGS